MKLKSLSKFELARRFAINHTWRAKTSHYNIFLSKQDSYLEERCFLGLILWKNFWVSATTIPQIHKQSILNRENPIEDKQHEAINRLRCHLGSSRY